MSATRTKPHDGSVPPMLTFDDLADMLKISRRTAERMKAAGKLPKPDLRIGKMPRWRPETVRAWLDRQAARN